MTKPRSTASETTTHNNIASTVQGGSTTVINLLLTIKLTGASNKDIEDNKHFRAITGSLIRTALTMKSIQDISNPADLSAQITVSIQDLLDSKRTAELGQTYEQRWIPLKAEVTQRETELNSLRKETKETTLEQQQKLKAIVQAIEASQPDSEIQKAIEDIRKESLRLRTQAEKQAINNSSLTFKLEIMLHEMGHEPAIRVTTFRGEEQRNIERLSGRS
jgi:hypothetical protein